MDCLPLLEPGIATEAAALAIEHAFEVLGLQTFHSGGLVRNIASMRVLEKNGFTKLGEFVYDGVRFGGEMIARYRPDRRVGGTCARPSPLKPGQEQSAIPTHP